MARSSRIPLYLQQTHTAPRHKRTPAPVPKKKFDDSKYVTLTKAPYFRLSFIALNFF
ncbi:hypothetical protein PGB90_001177 [Kerria lacca]